MQSPSFLPVVMRSFCSVMQNQQIIAFCFVQSDEKLFVL